MASTCTRLIVAIPAAALLWAGVTGCSFSASTSSDLDTGKVQEEVAKGIQEQTGVSATVTCPSPVKIEQGASFTCTALSQDGESGTVTVTQTDDQGNVRWQLEPTLESPVPSPTLS